MESLNNVLTLQQIVLSKNYSIRVDKELAVLTLQQIVLSKNIPLG